MKVFDNNMQILSKAMSLRMSRHAAIASNIANADTPGYRPKVVSFEEQLQKAAETGDSRKLSNVHERVQVVDDKAPRLDGNTVSMDKQMARLTENATVYSATAEFLKRKISMLKRTLQ